MVHVDLNNMVSICFSHNCHAHRTEQKCRIAYEATSQHSKSLAAVHNKFPFCSINAGGF